MFLTSKHSGKTIAKKKKKIIYSPNIKTDLGGSAVKNLPANAGDIGLIPGWERSPGAEMATH